ncbi:endonuclease/exonuclease/phosphatase family protein [Primorskyibacter sp. 2E107]|uniref:endonuclease/exonuclease/phosphatase family protein n=1 Tax=Primorskyibacter sp. 2E107 TaxID=3403458 RepID=UPI003AF75B72
MTTILDTLPAVTEDQRRRLLAARRTSDAHRALLAGVPAMNALQQGGTAGQGALNREVTIAAWNVERCLFPEETAAHLSDVAPDVLLLSEVDHGMARTGQRHTTEEVARALGMGYAYGVEFFELDLGSPIEREFCTDDFNAFGWHGNAVLSRVPFDRLAMVRLDDHGHWFATDGEASPDPDQPRLGGRMAILAVVPTGAGPLCVVSTHLESASDADHRHMQMERLLDAIDVFAPGLPVVIGGDLNTGNHLPPDYDWRRETLFALAEAQGYDWGNTADGMTTRPSLITRFPDRQMKLDWFATRGVTGQAKGLVSSLDAAGKPLSDHDCVWCRVAL